MDRRNFVHKETSRKNNVARKNPANRKEQCRALISILVRLISISNSDTAYTELNTTLISRVIIYNDNGLTI